MREENYRHQGSRGLFRSLGWMLTGGAVAAALLIGFGTGQLSDRLLSSLNTLLNPPRPEPKVDVQSLVVKQIRDASELTTAAFTMQAVVPTEQDASVSGFVIGKTKLLYIAYGEVQAGVDLSQLTANNVQIAGDSIRVQLPPPRILNSKIDVNRSQVYDYDRGFLGLGPDTGPELQSLAQQEALKKIESAARDEKLLERASDRAKLVVTQLLNTAGYKNVAIETQSIPIGPQVAPLEVTPTPTQPPL